MSEQSQPKAYWQAGLMVFGQVTGWIVGPIVLALVIGKWLDQRWQTSPWFFLGLSAVAFAITAWGIVRLGKKYIKEAEEASQKK